MRPRAALAGAVLIPLLAAAGPSRPDPGAAPPPGTVAPDKTILALGALLAQASDADHAQAIADRLEARRLALLSPTVGLMLRRGQREGEAGHLREALGDLGEAIALQPEQALPWRERAIVRAADGDPDGAIEDLGSALSRDPSDTRSWSALSQVEEAHSRPRQAYAAWERVLRLDPMIAGGAARLGRLHHRMVGDPT